jgi:predicted PurR-regulated permease PerM
MIALNLLPLFLLLLAKSISEQITLKSNPLSMALAASSDKVSLSRVNLIFGIVATIVTIGGGWVTVNKEIQKSSTRIEALEERNERLENKIDRGFDRVIDKIESLQKDVQNKQDRK